MGSLDWLQSIWTARPDSLEFLFSWSSAHDNAFVWLTLIEALSWPAALCLADRELARSLGRSLVRGRSPPPHCRLAHATSPQGLSNNSKGPAAPMQPKSAPPHLSSSSCLSSPSSGCSAASSDSCPRGPNATSGPQRWTGSGALHKRAQCAGGSTFPLPMGPQSCRRRSCAHQDILFAPQCLRQKLRPANGKLARSGGQVRAASALGELIRAHDQKIAAAAFCSFTGPPYQPGGSVEATSGQAAPLGAAGRQYLGGNFALVSKAASKVAAGGRHPLLEPHWSQFDGQGDARGRSRRTGSGAGRPVCGGRASSAASLWRAGRRLFRGHARGGPAGVRGARLGPLGRLLSRFERRHQLHELGGHAYPGGGSAASSTASTTVEACHSARTADSESSGGRRGAGSPQPTGAGNKRPRPSSPTSSLSTLIRKFNHDNYTSVCQLYVNGVEEQTRRQLASSALQISAELQEEEQQQDAEIKTITNLANSKPNLTRTANTASQGGPALLASANELGSGRQAGRKCAPDGEACGPEGGPRGARSALELSLGGQLGAAKQRACRQTGGRVNPMHLVPRSSCESVLFGSSSPASHCFAPMEAGELGAIQRRASKTRAGQKRAAEGLVQAHKSTGLVDERETQRHKRPAGGAKLEKRENERESGAQMLLGCFEDSLDRLPQVAGSQQLGKRAPPLPDDEEQQVSERSERQAVQVERPVQSREGQARSQLVDGEEEEKAASREIGGEGGEQMGYINGDKSLGSPQIVLLPREKSQLLSKVGPEKKKSQKSNQVAKLAPCLNAGQSCGGEQFGEQKMKQRKNNNASQKITTEANSAANDNKWRIQDKDKQLLQQQQQQQLQQLQPGQQSKIVRQPQGAAGEQQSEPTDATKQAAAHHHDYQSTNDCRTPAEMAKQQSKQTTVLPQIEATTVAAYLGQLCAQLDSLGETTLPRAREERLDGQQRASEPLGFDYTSLRSIGDDALSLVSVSSEFEYHNIHASPFDTPKSAAAAKPAADSAQQKSLGQPKGVQKSSPETRHQPEAHTQNPPEPRAPNESLEPPTGSGSGAANTKAQAKGDLRFPSFLGASSSSVSSAERGGGVGGAPTGSQLSINVGAKVAPGKRQAAAPSSCSSTATSDSNSTLLNLTAAKFAALNESIARLRAMSTTTSTNASPSPAKLDSPPTPSECSNRPRRIASGTITKRHKADGDQNGEAPLPLASKKGAATNGLTKSQAEMLARSGPVAQLASLSLVCESGNVRAQVEKMEQKQRTTNNSSNSNNLTKAPSNSQMLNEKENHQKQSSRQTNGPSSSMIPIHSRHLPANKR